MRKRPGSAHDRDQDERSDLGEAGQGPRQLARFAPLLMLLEGGSMQRQLVLNLAQQPHFGCDLGGQFRERHSGVAPMQVDGDGASDEPPV